MAANLETLLIIGKQYPIKQLDRVTHTINYFADLELRKITNKNEFVLLKRQGKNYEVIFTYNPNGYKGTK